MERLPPTMLDCPFRDDFPTFWSWQFPARHSWQRADGTNQSDMPIHLALKSLAWWNAQNDQDFGFNWHKFVRVLPWHSHLRTAIEKRHKYEQHRTNQTSVQTCANIPTLFSQPNFWIGFVMCPLATNVVFFFPLSGHSLLQFHIKTCFFVPRTPRPHSVCK